MAKPIADDIPTTRAWQEGRRIWQHPGYYDDYIPTERHITDASLVEKVRQLVAKGSRTRGRYTVTKEEEAWQNPEN